MGFVVAIEGPAVGFQLARPIVELFITLREQIVRLLGQPRPFAGRHAQFFKLCRGRSVVGAPHEESRVQVVGVPGPRRIALA